jgi:beta-glucosidase
MNHYLRICFAFLTLIMINNVTTASSDIKIEKMVKNLISQMSLEGKIDYIGGYEKFHIRGIERLGIPQITMADGPVGCRNYGKSTAYPATIGLAATWNRQLAGEFGKAIARDSRARGVHILLMPGVNIYRSPLCGRNFEYMGEDPYLTSEIAVATVKALQTQGVMATVKHYAGNNQEYDRHKISSDIDERTLYDIRLARKLEFRE